MSTIITDQLQYDYDRPQVPVSELGHRIIKNFRQNYDSGAWNPDTNYNWVPGQYADYTPLSSSSRIRAWCHIPYVGLNTAHSISHWIFYANGVEQGRHCVSGNHLEDMSSYVWDFASWGTTEGRIGYQMRSHGNDSHEVRPYTTRYWDGGGSSQVCRGQFVIEEYLTGV